MDQGTDFYLDIIEIVQNVQYRLRETLAACLLETETDGGGVVVLGGCCCGLLAEAVGGGGGRGRVKMSCCAAG